MKRSPMPPPDPAKRLKRRVPLKARVPQASASPARVRVPLRSPRDTGPSRKVRALVLARDGHACAACGVSIIGRPWSMQHRVPRRMGGDPRPFINQPSNLVVLCGSATTPGSCHLACERRDPEMHARGFWLRSWEDPAAVPVMLASEHGSGITVWLSPDGSYLHEPPAERAA